MTSDAIITVEKLSKAFPLIRMGEASLRHDLALLFGQKQDHFIALENISFTVQRGEGIAIMGRNGAGKTTLLRLLAGVLKPSKGSIQLHAAHTPLLGLGTGFTPVLTGRQNIILNAALLGWDREQTHQNMDSIISFADVGAFINRPVKTYSSGMLARLAMSIALHCVPDILLIDELLAVGDVAFQQKCWDKLAALKKSGRTLVIVSHQTHSLANICERGIWLDKGQMQASGSFKEVQAAYQEALHA